MEVAKKSKASSSSFSLAIQHAAGLLFRAWRLKLFGTVLFILAYAVFINYFEAQVSSIAVLQPIAKSGALQNVAFFTFVVMLFLLWTMSGSKYSSYSFVEMDMRRRQEASSGRRTIVENEKVICVIWANGQVKYYPADGPESRGMTIDEYLLSHFSEIDSWSVSLSDIADIAEEVERLKVYDRMFPDGGYYPISGGYYPASGGAKDEVDHILPKAEKESAYRTQFQIVVEQAIKRLEQQIVSAEDKASGLLDSGRTYLKTGIFLYAFSILVWQVVLWGLNYEWNWGIGAGVISCSIAFIAVEFLAAWFLKQYRHYDDSIQTYMKIRSGYERYLLAYHTVGEFSGVDQDADGYAKCRDELLKSISVEMGWPDIKDVNSNDFNYMLKAVESAATLIEKVRGVSRIDRNKAAE